MTIKLRKVARGPHLPTLVASSITREIAHGRLRPGEQLPTEQTLASTFGVSRNVVREAIARLRSEGRILSQQGRGAFVADGLQTSILKIEHDASRPRDAFIALFQFREILEVPASALAARSHDKDDLDRMRLAIAAMARAPYGSVDWLRGDLEFHQAIARASRNTYVLQVMVFVSERVRDSILAAGNQHSEDMAQVTEREHRRILLAIELRDEAAASAGMRDHLTSAEMRVGAMGARKVTAELPAEPASVPTMKTAQGVAAKRPAGRRRNPAATQ